MSGKTILSRGGKGEEKYWRNNRLEKLSVCRTNFRRDVGDVSHEAFYRYSSQGVKFRVCFSRHQPFAIFITHTSFQSYHAWFAQSYLQSVPDHGIVKDSDNCRQLEYMTFAIQLIEESGWIFSLH